MVIITVQNRSSGSSCPFDLNDIPLRIKNVKQALAEMLSKNPDSFQLWFEKDNVGTFLHDDDEVPLVTLDYYIKQVGCPDLTGTFLVR